MTCTQTPRFFFKGQFYLRIAVQFAGIKVHVRMDGNRAIATIIRGHQTKISVQIILVLVRIAGFQTLLVGHDPDLQEMHRVGS